jgi:hypothetical protein
MKQSETLFYDVVNAKGVAVHFKMLGHNRALMSHKMYTMAFPDAGPYKIVITKPQPANRGFDSGEVE